jgi:regulator of replication initiation timing
MDMNESARNENDINQGVSIEKLLQTIGLRDIELVMHEEATNKLKEQAMEIVKQNSFLKTEVETLKKKLGETIPTPLISPELEQLRKVNESKDIQIKQQENMTHSVAIERDNAKKEVLRLSGLAKDLQGLLDEANQKNVSLLAEKTELIKERDDLVLLVQKRKTIKK